VQVDIALRIINRDPCSASAPAIISRKSLDTCAELALPHPPKPEFEVQRAVTNSVSSICGFGSFSPAMPIGNIAQI